MASVNRCSSDGLVRFTEGQHQEETGGFDNAFFFCMLRDGATIAAQGAADVDDMRGQMPQTCACRRAALGTCIITPSRLKPMFLVSRICLRHPDRAARERRTFLASTDLAAKRLPRTLCVPYRFSRGESHRCAQAASMRYIVIAPATQTAVRW